MSAENQRKILVIDDDEITLMKVKQILEKNGYTIVCTNSGKSGLEKAAHEQPAAIILDRRMPEMDGNETLIELKSNDNTKNIPVMMLTSDNQISDVSSSFELGAVAYIVKPFNADNLLTELRKTLSKHGR